MEALQQHNSISARQLRRRLHRKYIAKRLVPRRRALAARRSHLDHLLEQASLPTKEAMTRYS